MARSCITKDNVPIQIDFVVYRQVIDAVASVVAVTNFDSASQRIAGTRLRAVIGNIVLDDVLARREQINEDLRRKLDEVTERWGVVDGGRDPGGLTPARGPGSHERLTPIAAINRVPSAILVSRHASQ